MPKVLPLIHELERRARALGSSWEEESRRLGFDRTTLAHVRSGRTRISLALLHRIAAAYPTDEAIKRLAWEYLLHDVESLREREARTATLTQEGHLAERTLGGKTLKALAAFVGEFPRHAVSGTGLLLEGGDAALLTAALSFIESECRVRSVQAIRRLASTKVPASEVPVLCATPLLLVDRIDFLSIGMTSVLSRRGEFRKVVVASQMTGSGADAPGLFTRITVEPSS